MEERGGGARCGLLQGGLTLTLTLTLTRTLNLTRTRTLTLTPTLTKVLLGEQPLRLLRRDAAAGVLRVVSSGARLFD